MTDYVFVIINIPPGVEGYKNAKIVKQEVAGEVLIDAEAKEIFDDATKYLIGVNHKIMLLVGTQVVKGVNYHYICESEVIGKAEKSYLTRFVINDFDKTSTIVSINLLKNENGELV